jgi:hypothetical protein
MTTIDPRITALLQQILNPEDLGLASSPGMRDVVRFALGRLPVESTLVAYFYTGPDAVSLHGARSRLTIQAIDARAEYDRAAQAGGEPPYPSWTDDLMTVLAHVAPHQPSPPTRQTPAACDVLAERNRQKSVEGWTPENDDLHSGGEMVEAAICYAQGYMSWREAGDQQRWPWSHRWWKPNGGKRRNLEKAAALILAEIERLDRSALKSASQKAVLEQQGPTGTSPLQTAVKRLDGITVGAVGARMKLGAIAACAPVLNRHFGELFAAAVKRQVHRLETHVKRLDGFRAGDIVRYGSGSTALMRLRAPHAGGWHGDQCMGGYTFAGVEALSPASKEDLETWEKSAKWRVWK